MVRSIMVNPETHNNQSEATRISREKLAKEGWTFHNWAGKNDDTPIMKKGKDRKIILTDGEVYDL